MVIGIIGFCGKLCLLKVLSTRCIKLKQRRTKKKSRYREGWIFLLIKNINVCTKHKVYEITISKPYPVSYLLFLFLLFLLYIYKETPFSNTGKSPWANWSTGKSCKWNASNPRKNSKVHSQGRKIEIGLRRTSRYIKEPTRTSRGTGTQQCGTRLPEIRI